MNPQILSKHTIKIQLIALVSIVGFVIYWTFTASAYVYDVKTHGERLDKVEDKLEDLATKDDLQILKNDIKDFIIK
jgi:CRISPR/Cas system type I-B associated protein Csh2 (Cas7 group RAMP superfamily)